MGTFPRRRANLNLEDAVDRFAEHPGIRGTTIVGLRYKGHAALGGDGQVTFGETIMKHKATKVRKLWNGTILAGVAGAAGDALALFERFEGKLEEHRGNLLRASVELVKEWRTDRYLRRLDALLAVLDTEHALILSGEGDLIEPDDGIVAIGSGGAYAMAAARAYLDADPKMGPREVVERSLRIAASICVYTNENIVVEEL
ncbi:MAG TPA: ATP-dependent protease subunit HslV [Candidatus Latescibacteria bacterium]|nr:ATP-dependent protease subunit HslV [Candidatus Latescibacterota bacterium]